MKTARSIPAEISEGLRAKGLIQEKLGSIEFGPAWPVMTLISATTEKRARVKISAASSPTWVRAESSIPITTIAVMIDDPDDADRGHREGRFGERC